MATTKRMRAMLAVKPSSDAPLPLVEAVGVLKKFPPAKFDQTVEIHIRLGIDPKQADQIIRGSLVLPHGIGKSKRVVVFAKGNLADDAKAAGAEEVGADELAKKIKEGWTDFDVCIAAPDMMGLVGPLGKVLGPRGLMPSPRAGTVTADIKKTVSEYKAGKVEFRNDPTASCMPSWARRASTRRSWSTTSGRSSITSSACSRPASAANTSRASPFRRR
jgi:large subunit ribosomal protein L1